MTAATSNRNPSGSMVPSDGSAAGNSPELGRHVPAPPGEHGGHPVGDRLRSALLGRSTRDRRVGSSHSERPLKNGSRKQSERQRNHAEDVEDVEMYRGGAPGWGLLPCRFARVRGSRSPFRPIRLNRRRRRRWGSACEGSSDGVSRDWGCCIPSERHSRPRRVLVDPSSDPVADSRSVAFVPMHHSPKLPLE